MSIPPVAPKCAVDVRATGEPSPPRRRPPGLVARALRLLFRAAVPGLVAILVAFARALGGPRYEPPHLPQNPTTQVEKKR